MNYPTRLDLCGGKYSVIYDLEIGQSECLRYGEKWRDLCGDKMVLAMFDRIVELEDGIRQHLAHHANGCTYLSHLITPNAEVTGVPALSARPVD
jgi:hypothetical protein